MGPCPVAKLSARFNPGSGTWRWYLGVGVQPCATVHTQRVDTTREDQTRGFNRAEHLRQHSKPTDDSDEDGGVCKQCYPWGSDAESLNDLLQSALHKGRMIAFSRPNSSWSCLGSRSAKTASPDTFAYAAPIRPAQPPEK
jgi:hypothetical protein